MTETLWAPWRMDYIKSPKEELCVFCAAAADIPAENAKHQVLFSTESEFVIMNRYPYTHGHIMVCPKRHVSSLEELSADEQQRFFRLVTTAASVLRKAFSPQGMNLGMNLGKAGGAGIETHIHMHIVPRWEGDTNFMPMLADCRVMPEHLDKTYETLLAAFGAF